MHQDISVLLKLARMRRLPVQMEVQVNTAHLLTQPQQKLQLNYKTTITQNCQKIKLYGHPKIKELKKSHSSRPVGGAEMRSQLRSRMGSPTPTGSG